MDILVPSWIAAGRGSGKPQLVKLYMEQLMSHKTKIKAGGGMPPSTEQIIREHSKARVITPSTKRYMVEQGSMFAMPKFSRQLTDADVIESQVRKYCK